LVTRLGELLDRYLLAAPVDDQRKIAQALAFAAAELEMTARDRDEREARRRAWLMRSSTAERIVAEMVAQGRSLDETERQLAPLAIEETTIRYWYKRAVKRQAVDARRRTQATIRALRAAAWPWPEIARHVGLHEASARRLYRRDPLAR
jgi:DNA-binding NarL/FixJ family response regulator